MRYRVTADLGIVAMTLEDASAAARKHAEAIEGSEDIHLSCVAKHGAVDLVAADVTQITVD